MSQEPTGAPRAPHDEAAKAWTPSARARFGAGTHGAIQDLLGAHPLSDARGVRFAVWAPNARAASVVGSFNGWDPSATPLTFLPDVGVWAGEAREATAGDLYQYALTGPGGEALPWRADPVASSAELAPARASVITPPPAHRWSDAQWMQERAARHALGAPLSIYELHAGSWRRHSDGRPLSYRELGAELIPYVKSLGFTHIELMPITEHPFEGSWGYQTLGLFAPTCRYGTPDDLRAFIDACHREEVGVILDWVPGHFPLDEHGLARFDGTHLYEHADPRRGLHPDWGTGLYQYGRPEVRDFLISSALFWLDSFHFDGLRVDAVASMLYLDYSRAPGEWVPNERGGREHLEAVAFLKRLNEQAYLHHPGCLMIAEESTSWPGVSAPTYDGGLGFGRKWNMGWMNDTLRYIQEDPIHRRWHHHLLTFGLVYAYSERFILPISHDEVVHGKGSLLGKMPGDEWQRFAHLRLYLSFMWAHPGQKLLFMGAEIAQEREWSHERALDWGLLDRPLHQGVTRLLSTLNALYRATPALHARDHAPDGFAWLLADDAERSALSFVRRAEGDEVIAVFNFTPVPRLGELVGAEAGGYVCLLNSDAGALGGSGVGPRAGQALTADKALPWQGRPAALCVDLPPLGALLLRRAASREGGGQP
jgi:1,4-alpha-glucan branching enzyme